MSPANSHVDVLTLIPQGVTRFGAFKEIVR